MTIKYEISEDGGWSFREVKYHEQEINLKNGNFKLKFTLRGAAE